MDGMTNMEFVKHLTGDSCIEMNLLSSGGVIFKDVEHDSVVGLSKSSMDLLFIYYSDTGWNTSFNKKHRIKITVLDTLYTSHLKDVGLIKKINCALDSFPELRNRTVYIGLLNRGLDVHFAGVDVDNLILSFNRNIILSLEKEPELDGLNTTIFHELMHIVTSIKKLPQTEEYCSIYATARMPSDLVDSDEIPYITENGDRKTNADLCRKAVEFNESGKRGYIKYLKSLVKEIDLS